MRAKFAAVIALTCAIIVSLPPAPSDAATLLHGWTTVRKQAGAKGQLCRHVFTPDVSYGIKVRVDARNATTTVWGRYEIRSLNSPYTWAPAKPGTIVRVGTAVGSDQIEVRVQLKANGNRTAWTRWYAWGDVLPCP
jgi:hypothetical protein